MKRKSGVTKRTWDKNAKRFAAQATEAWSDLNAFVESRCKLKGTKWREIWCDKFRDELCEIVDKYVNLNCDIHAWCRKNGVDPVDFMCDVNNLGYDIVAKEND